MAKTRRKDYTLYLKLNGKEIELLKGTLGEIDAFTTYFMDTSSMCKKIIDCNDKIEYEFYIKSSKNNRYTILYSKYRKFLNPSNINQIMAYLKQLPRDELISFLDNFTPVIYYIEDGVNNNRIPIYKLYNDLINERDYNYSLNRYIKSDYKNQRTISMYLIDKSVLNLSDSLIIDEDYINKIILDIKNNLINLLPTINKKTRVVNSDDTNNSLDDSVETLYEIIYMVINSNLDTYEKEEELELFIDDEDKLRAAKELLYQKRM